MNWLGRLLGRWQVTGKRGATPYALEDKPLVSVNVRRESGRQDGIQSAPDFSGRHPLPSEYTGFKERLIPVKSLIRETWNRVFRDLLEFPEKRVRIVSLGGDASESDQQEFSNAYFFLKLTNQLPSNIELLDVKQALLCFGPGSMGREGIFRGVRDDIKAVVLGVGEDEFGWIADIEVHRDTRTLDFRLKKSPLPNSKRSIIVLYHDEDCVLRNATVALGLSPHVSFFGYGMGDRDYDIKTILKSFEKAPEAAVRIVSVRSGQAAYDYSVALEELKRLNQIPPNVEIFEAVVILKSDLEAYKEHIDERIRSGIPLLVLATDAKQDLTREMIRRHGRRRVVRLECRH